MNSIPQKPTFCIVDDTGISPYDTSMEQRYIIATYADKTEAVRHLKALIEADLIHHYCLMGRIVTARGELFSRIPVEASK